MNTTINQVKSLLSQVDNVAKQYGLENELSSLSKMIEKTKFRKINLLICGEFKRGKSSLINALLDEDICPEERGIATSAISIISYGDTPKVIRHFGKLNEVAEDKNKDGVEMLTEEIGIGDISKFADGSSSDIQNTIMLEILIPNERLKSGLTLIDTPGVGSLDPRHLFLTLYALPKADMIYFVTDSEEPLQGSELAFYQKRIASTGKINRILVNKSDLKRRKEVDLIVQDIKEKVGDASVKVMPVSAKLWKEFNTDSSDVDIQQSSHCLEVRDAIRLDMGACAKYLSESVRTQFIAFLGKLLHSIEDRKKAVIDTKDVEQKKLELQQQIADLKQIRDNVSNPDSELRRSITRTLKDAQKDVLSLFSKESILLSSSKFDEILKDKKTVGDDGEAFVISEINKSITALAENLDKEIDASIENTLRMVGKEIPLADEHFNGKVYDGITPIQQTFADKAMSLTRQALPVIGVGTLATGAGAVGVGLVGGIIGASEAAIMVAAPYIAIPIGIAAGIGFLVKSFRDNKKQQTIAHLRSQVAPRITIALNEMRQYIQNRYDDFNDLLVQSLKDTANQLSKQMQAVCDSMKQCEAGEQEKKAEEKRLDNQIKFIQGLISQAQVFKTNPFVTKKPNE